MERHDLHRQLLVAQRELFALAQVRGLPDDDPQVRAARDRVSELEERLEYDQPLTRRREGSG